MEVRKIKASETYSIRLEVLRKNIDLPFKFQGDLDIKTFHLGAFKNNKLIAVSSFMNVKNDSLPGNQYQLRGMATLLEYQGQGAGRFMLHEAIVLLKKLKVNYLWCNARLAAVDFYKKQGFKIMSDQFDIKIIGPHYVMGLELN